MQTGSGLFFVLKIVILSSKLTWQWNIHNLKTYFPFEDVFPEGHLIRHSNQASLSTLKIMFDHVPNKWVVKYCMYMYENVYALLYI